MICLCLFVFDVVLCLFMFAFRLCLYLCWLTFVCCLLLLGFRVWCFDFVFNLFVSASGFVRLTDFCLVYGCWLLCCKLF